MLGWVFRNTQYKKTRHHLWSICIIFNIMLLLLWPIWYEVNALRRGLNPRPAQLGSAFTSSSFGADKAMQVVYKHPTLWSISQLPSGPRIVSICCVLQWSDSGNFLSRHSCHVSHWLNGPRWLQRCPKREIQTKATLHKQTRMFVLLSSSIKMLVRHVGGGLSWQL